MNKGNCYKNQRQIEFTDLLQELAHKGYRQADVARMLGMTGASISRIVSGSQNPRQTTLDALRSKVQDILGGKVAPPPAPRTDEVHQKLDDLKRQDRSAYDAVRSTIEALHDRINSDQEKILDLAAKSGADHLAAQRINKKRAGKPNANKPATTPSPRRAIIPRPS